MFKSLLDNRKDLTPRQSIESLTKYARQQDYAISVRSVRQVRARTYFGTIIFFSISAYLTKEWFFGHWIDLHPRSFLSASTEGVVANKREYYTPQIYLKDLDNWKMQLKKKQLSVLNSKIQKHSENHH